MLKGMKAYSQDLRDRVMAAVDKGLQQTDIVATFGICRATLTNWCQQRRQTGQYAARPHGGGQHRVLSGYAELVRSALHVQPDLSLEELCAHVKREAQVSVSSSMMCRELQILNRPLKKSRSMTVNAKPRGSSRFGRRSKTRSSRR